MHPLLNLCKPADIAEKSGIYISKHIANGTIWDTLARENPTHVDCASSVNQINHITQYVDDNTVLLDYGCGYGRVAEHLLPRVSLAGYIGLDSSYEMLKLFATRYNTTDQEQTTPLLLLNADINHPPLISNAVDLAVVVAVLRHNHKSVVKQAMGELTRVVKPGGTVLVYDAFPRAYSLLGIAGSMYQMGLNLLGRPFKNGPVRYYTSSEIKRLFAEFSSVTLVPVGFAILPPTIAILPRPVAVLWQKLIATPVNSLLERITPALLKPYFAEYVDVVAKR